MRRSHRIAISLAVLSGLTLGPLVLDADAQYFGRNKVQYEDFDWKVLATDQFDIFFYPEERQAVEIAGMMAERWNTRLSRLLEHEFRNRQPLIFYANHPHFRQTNVIPGLIGEGTGGVTEPFRRRVIMPFAGPLAETDHVLGHELVHAYQFSMLGQALGTLPLWVVEGMAEYFSVGPVSAHTAMWLRDAMEHDRLPTIRDLYDPEYFPYRFGHALWAYIAGRYGKTAVLQVLQSAPAMGGPERALVEVTGLPLDTLAQQWHTAIREAYSPLQEITAPPDSFGRELINERTSGEINLAPALSPDGRHILFLSERSLFAIELYVADAETGEIIRKVTETALDPHFESLQFISSAGAWHPDGDRFVFAAVTGGQPILAIARPEGGGRREIAIREVGEIFNPAWSPDGRRIAFSAIRGGLSDLYVYDLETEELRQLTDDPFADLQPAWSPDGDRIAFVTDRFTTDLRTLDIGEYRLATIDPGSGSIQEVPAFSRGKHANPQWSPDAGSLYFISDVNGISNVFRTDLRTGGTSQVTGVFTGVSGITEMSPALSVASETGALAFSVYADGKYTIYRTDTPEMVAVSAGPLAVEASARVLPPHDRVESSVLSYLQSPTVGLPDEMDFSVGEYGAGLSLDRIAGASFVAGADRFGSFIGGGTALIFADMLNQHQLGTLLQINGSFDDLTAAVSYQNQEDRFIWGLTAQRIPIVFGTFGVSRQVIEGEPALVRQELIFRETNYRVAATGWYPFNQAQRVEFSAGYRNIGFEIERRTIAIGEATGRRLIDEETEESPFDNLSLGTASTALVYDNSFFGATSPILGQRYRFELQPTFGTINWVEGLGDFRRYVMPFRPFTLAFRALHFGRYGPDSGDERLTDIYLGYAGLVRGYQSGSFDVGECEPTGGDPCPVFNQLLGTRIGVLNAELRFPLLGVLGLGSGYYGAFPLELALFGDAGVAWRSDLEDTSTNERAFFLGGDREPIYSAGATLRANIFGYLVMQFDVAHAFERDRWVTQFSFIPGY